MLTKNCEWENQSPGSKHDDGDNIFAQICLKGHTPGRRQLQWCLGDECLEPLLPLVSLVQSPFQRWRAKCSVCREEESGQCAAIWTAFLFEHRHYQGCKIICESVPATPKDMATSKPQTEWWGSQHTLGIQPHWQNLTLRWWQLILNRCNRSLGWRGDAAVAEHGTVVADTSLVASTHVGWLMSLLTPALRDPMPLLASASTCTHTHILDL